MHNWKLWLRFDQIYSTLRSNRARLSDRDDSDEPGKPIVSPRWRGVSDRLDSPGSGVKLHSEAACCAPALTSESFPALNLP